MLTNLKLLSEKESVLHDASASSQPQPQAALTALTHSIYTIDLYRVRPEK